MAELTREKEDLVSAERLRQILSYNEIDGLFTWLQSSCGRTGEIAGVIGKQGYWRIGIGPHVYYGHRLAWLYVHGRWPSFIDHIDGDKSNNRIVNLREVDRAQNSYNQKANARRAHQGLPKGVYFIEKGSVYRAIITARGERHDLGRFLTPETAHEAYISASKLLHGSYGRDK